MECDIADKLSADEAVIFIASRHHWAPTELVSQFFGGEGETSLLDNEIEILQGLRKQLEDGMVVDMGTNIEK